MKREFLQNFKVGDQPLPNEVIEAIMAENGRDVQAEQAKYADYDSIKEQLETAKNGLKAFDGVDVAKLRDEITTLNGQLATKDQEWQGKLDKMAFDGDMKDAIVKAKGRDVGAVIGALGAEKVAELRASKNRTADINAALEGLKKDSGYLFDTDPTPPPFSAGTGTGGFQNPGANAFNFGFTGVRAKPAEK